jgi:hypothetical protein
MGELAPAQTTTHIVMHLPFPAADIGDRAWQDAVRLSIDGTADTTYPHALRLQQYATDLGDDMRAALPHRTGSVELPWRGAWLDRWNFNVVCGSVVEAVDVEVPDWAGYRDAVYARRQAMRDQATRDLGREPLWICVVHVVQADASSADLDRIAKTLTDNGEPCVLDAFPDVAVRLSFDACAAVPMGRLDVAVGVARMLGVHTAIWAAAMEFDRELLPLLVGTNEKESLAELERRANRLRETSRRVRAFRAPLANTAPHLSELDGPLWQKTADRWALEGQLDALSSRVDALQLIHGDLIATLTAKHAQRLNRIALALTLISGCTAILTFVQFVFVDPTPTEVRVTNAIIVLAVAALALCLWWIASRRTGSR